MSSRSSNLSSSQSTMGVSRGSSASTSTKNGERLTQLLKSLYHADHQIELLYLHAEADTLLQELQTLKQQGQGSKYATAAYNGENHNN